MIGQVISHYKILEKIGEGGMGIVYKAQDLKLDRPVAVKFLPQHLSASDEDKARFVQEAKAASSLNYPNILTIHDIDKHDDTLFIVMEYLQGDTVKSKIRNEKLTVQQVLDIALQIADGLKAAHQGGIVHRDIKSDNIMVMHDGRVKIMDFGLAKLKGSVHLTKTGSTVGTIAYMSPEQIQRGLADHRSDIWAFGVVFYEMLTGELPFKADHEAAWMYMIVNEQPLVPSALDHQIPHQVDAAVMNTLEKDPARRYQRMDEVVKVLRQLRTEVEKAEQAPITKAIAVLPFDNISPDKESDYFSDGLTEELIANLSRLKDIGVVSRTTSMQYKGTKKDIKTIGRELGARYMLEGSVRKFQDNLRITVQLIDVESDRQLWAETYKGKLADVFDIQEQVSKQIVDALTLQLSPTEKVVLTKRATLNAEAFDYYLRARDFLYRATKSSVKFAIQLFQKAIELDPRYAAAYAGLGEAYATFYRLFERKEVWVEKAIESSLKALMYDANLSEAYAALGLSYYNKRSFDEAVTASKKAIELDPKNFLGYWILGRIYHSTDRDREAIDLFKNVLSLNPEFYAAYDDLQMVYERLGENQRLAETLQTSLQVYPRYLSRHPDDARAHIFFATNLMKVGRTEEAKLEAAKALELSPNDPLMLYNTACFYARSREKPLAVETLKNAVAAGYEHYEWIRRDSDLDSIRNEPEYIELMKGK